MYKVKIVNDEYIYEIHGIKEKLKTGSVVKGINTIDSFSFNILPSNRYFNSIKDLKTLVSVYNTNKDRYEFYGRVLYSSVSMDDTGLISKNVICESYLGFLCDSLQEYVAEKNWTVSGLLKHIIDVHNAQAEPHKQFYIGNVNVTDPNDNLYLGIQIENTWKTLEEKLINVLGGEISFRVVDGKIYLDYLEKIGSEMTNPIKLSKNMKAITREDNPLDYVSRLIPYGCKLKDKDGNETEERLDITSVNNGRNYIENAEAVAAFGIRYGTVTFDDVTVASNLLAKGIEHLEECSRVQVKYSVEALDLSLLGLDISDFEVGNYHPVINPLLGIDDNVRIIKKTIDICEEVKSSIEIGDNFKTASDIAIEQAGKINSANQVLEKVEVATSNLEKTSKLTYEAATAAEAAANSAANDAATAQRAADAAEAAANSAVQSAADANNKADAAQSAVGEVAKNIAAIEATVSGVEEAIENAHTAAETASTKADEAKTAAEAAKADAETAKSMVQTAQTASENAVTKATEASNTAAEAKGIAESASGIATSIKSDVQAAEEEIANLHTSLETLSNTMQTDYVRDTDLSTVRASLESQISQNAAQIEATVTRVTEVDETSKAAAAEAKSLAEAAQTKANEAQAQAAQATADAEAAQTAAATAAAAAANAQSEADKAKAAADTAKGVADKAEEDLEQAKADLASVSSRVDATEEEVAAAERAVAAAQSAADKAKADAAEAATKAATAQTTADAAVINAQAAQTTADNAAAAAQSAQEQATAAGSAAAAARQTADAAAEAAANAQATADTAKTNAQNAQNKANEAAAAASAAQTAADEAEAKAAQAASDLATAKQNLENVKSRVDATEEEIAAAQQAVETAQTAADQARADAAAAQSTADTAKANAATAKTAADNAKKAADQAQADADAAKAAADKAQGDVNALAVRVGTAEAKIIENADAIALKASRVEVAETLGGYYTKSETDAAITTESNRITTHVSETYTTIDDFDALKIGGRNLLINTSLDGKEIKVDGAFKAMSGITNWKNENRVLTLECSVSGSSECYYRFMNPASVGLYGFEKGETYTISGKIKVSTKSGTMTSVSVRSQHYVSGWTGGLNKPVITADSDEWIYFEGQHEIPSTATGVYFSIQTYYSSSWSGTIQLQELKLEKGTKATDWTPSPIDMATSEDITTVASELRQEAGSIEARVTTSEGNIASLRTDLNGISSTVQDHTGKISALEQTSEGFTFTLNNMSVGGRNLIAGTSLDTIYSGNKGSNSYKDVWTGKTIDIPTGTEYVVSFEAKADVAQAIQCFFYSPNTTTSSKSSTGQSGTGADGACNVILTTEWKRYWVKWTQTAATAAKNVIVGRNATANNVYIRAVKLEEGKIPTSWTPAPEDVDSDISNAAKTATNFISYDATNGLLVGNKSNGSWSGNRAQILPTAFNILDASGTAISSFGEFVRIGKASEGNVVIKANGQGVEFRNGDVAETIFDPSYISLADNAKNATIYFCNRTGRISASTIDTNNFLHLDSDNISLSAVNNLDLEVDGHPYNQAFRADLKMDANTVVGSIYLVAEGYGSYGSAWIDVTAGTTNPYLTLAVHEGQRTEISIVPDKISMNRAVEMGETLKVTGELTASAGIRVNGKTINDTKEGIYIAKEGYMQLQRASSSPYIDFIKGTGAASSGRVGINASTGYMEFTKASRYTFDSVPYINDMKMAAVCSGTADAGSVAANSYVDVEITFPFTFSSTPKVVVGLWSSSTSATLGGISVAVASRTTTGAVLRVFNNTSGARSPDMFWIATV